MCTAIQKKIIIINMLRLNVAFLTSHGAKIRIRPVLKVSVASSSSTVASTSPLSDMKQSSKALSPASSANFKQIRTSNKLYVDKTKIIFDRFLSDHETKYHFLSRPRRFGKSLICSTIGELFLGNSGLFEGLDIHDKWNFETEKRPVIHLDFSSISYSSPQITMKCLADVLQTYAHQFEVSLPTDCPPSYLLKKLIEALYDKYGKAAVLIIDEYDAPFHQVMSADPKIRYEMTENMNNFYNTLKSLDSRLRLVYITGILRLTQLSLFSGLNNVEDHTFDLHTNEICGYTPEELVKNFRPHLEELRLMLSHPSVDHTLALLRNKYYGYHFGHDPDTKTLGDGIFNPFEINRILKSYTLRDHWIQSGNPKLLVDRILNIGDSRYVLHNSSITVSELESPTAIDDVSLPCLEYFTGYSTIKNFNDDGTLTLGPPNKSIKDHMIGVIASKLTPRAH